MISSIRHEMKSARIAVVLLVFSLLSFGQDNAIPRSYPIIVRTFPHDPAAFTQGLLYYNGLLYESTGLVGHSTLRGVDPADGRVIKSVSVPDLFAEGLARMGLTLVQLSWQEKTALIYTLPELKQTGFFTYSGEGWGLTSDSSSFIMSNGSDTLYQRSKQFVLQKKIPVTFNDKPVKNLNELEYVNGTVYANVWYNSAIMAIRYRTGKVQRVIDCSELVSKAQTRGADDVLNGIAYNPDKGTFFVTGKNWPVMFEVKW